MPTQSSVATASTATATARCCCLGADLPLRRPGFRHAAEPMAQIAVDHLGQQDHVVAQAVDDLLAHRRVERLALARNLIPIEQPLAHAEDGGEAWALARPDLLLALVELLARQRGADRLGRALQEPLQPADADGLVDPLS